MAPSLLGFLILAAPITPLTQSPLKYYLTEGYPPYRNPHS